MTDPAVSLAEAERRLRIDHDLLGAAVDGLSDAELAAAYATTAGPLGDACDSLHDLLAHVLMWDEINLAVLTEAAAGRSHWSLSPVWERPDIGRALNRAGVAAGRLLPATLLRYRLDTTLEAVLDQLTGTDPPAWAGVAGIGATATRAWTVPGQPPFWHAALHLGRPIPPTA